MSPRHKAKSRKFLSCSVEQPTTGEISQMFAKHNPLKSNHVHAYRVFEQTSLCPADEQERELRSMIQNQPIPNRCSSQDFERQPGRDFPAGRLGGARSTDRRQVEFRKRISTGGGSHSK